MQAEDEFGHLSSFVHLFVGLCDHGDEYLDVRLPRPHNLLKTWIQTKVAYVLLLAPTLTVAVGYARLNKLRTNKQSLL